MTLPGSPHRAWVEIDHEALRSNLDVIRRTATEAQVIAVVKANAYGHGAVAAARTLLGAGVERLAVATVDEAIELREAGVDAPILVLWGIGPDEAAIVAARNLEPIVYDEVAVDLLEAAGSPVARRVGPVLAVVAILWILKKLLARSKD